MNFSTTQKYGYQLDVRRHDPLHIVFAAFIVAEVGPSELEYGYEIATPSSVLDRCGGFSSKEEARAALFSRLKEHYL